MLHTLHHKSVPVTISYPSKQPPKSCPHSFIQPAQQIIQCHVKANTATTTSRMAHTSMTARQPESMHVHLNARARGTTMAQLMSSCPTWPRAVPSAQPAMQLSPAASSRRQAALRCHQTPCAASQQNRQERTCPLAWRTRGWHQWCQWQCNMQCQQARPAQARQVCSEHHTSAPSWTCCSHLTKVAQRLLGRLHCSCSHRLVLGVPERVSHDVKKCSFSIASNPQDHCYKDHKTAVGLLQPCKTPARAKDRFRHAPLGDASYISGSTHSNMAAAEPHHARTPQVTDWRPSGSSRCRQHSCAAADAGRCTRASTCAQHRCTAWGC
jgi:hypothetical protein